MFNVIRALHQTIGTAALVLAGLALPATEGRAGADPYLGDIQPMGFNFCPRGWLPAEGQILPINSNQSLYSLFGTMYGGDGRTTFALPDLRGRELIGHDGSQPQGARGGSETFQLTIQNLPTHSHTANGNNLPADKHGPGTDFFSAPYEADGVTKVNIYNDGPPDRVMDPASISTAGAGQQVSKRSPYLAVTWCVAVQGLFPSRN